jgi:hypothetical protein
MKLKKKFLKALKAHQLEIIQKYESGAELTKEELESLESIIMIRHRLEEKK